jgi:hypothetical protein
MSREPQEVLSSFMDGEAVAADELAAALLAPGAREALVDFAALRARLADDDSRPSPALHRSMSQAFARRRRGPTWRILRAAAAVVVLALAAIGALSLKTRIEHPVADEPPRATRVIQFTPGVDWHEGDPR